MVKKDLKLNIKNTQIAKAIQLDKLKEKLAAKKNDAITEQVVNKPAVEQSQEAQKMEVQDQTRRKARSTSVFAETTPAEIIKAEETGTIAPSDIAESTDLVQSVETPKIEELIPVEDARAIHTQKDEEIVEIESPAPKTVIAEAPPEPVKVKEEVVVLGPTGRHVNDLLTPPKPKPRVIEKTPEPKDKQKKPEDTSKAKTEKVEPRKVDKTGKFKEFRDIKPARKLTTGGRFDGRDRQGLRTSDEGGSQWRKKRGGKNARYQQEDLTIRPSELTIRLPITVKDLAVEMKLKASQLIQKLFLQGIVLMINDALDDDTTIQLLGEEFGCQITIDTTEEERIRITDKTIREEITETNPSDLIPRAPIVTFMGHVDHGKTSLIDYIRKSTTAAGEAGAITQHIGAFSCKTDVGPITILDTPGHEAFSEMRARGAEVTDIVVLVVAGDEGIREQTKEAINHAKDAGVTIVVAINKSDKPNFDAENVYRQLAELNLLPESWGGQIITVNCSAKTGEGVRTLLDMLALQSEILELKADPNARARGNIIESEMHKGLGAVITLLVQNGTLRLGDSIVFGEHFGKVKTMKNEFGKNLEQAPPSTPVEVTGLSGLPDAGQEFIVVSTEKEARAIAQARMIGKRQLYLQQSKKASVENFFQDTPEPTKKVLKIVLRADVQGSLEALKSALLKIKSEKAEVDVISTGIGEVSESDVILASASKAIILGFHTQVESHADSLVKEHKVKVLLHNIIYHAVDEAKLLLTGLLDKIAQENEAGKATIKAVFKASQLGKIAGCMVTEGTIRRNNYARLIRNKETVWKGTISSLKRDKEDVREVNKGYECGILLANYTDIEEGDIIEAYEIKYISQEL